MSKAPTTNINPTEGFVEYIKDIKPFHTKILDVNIDQVFFDDIKVTIKDTSKLSISTNLADIEVLRSCGWGVEWDPIRTTCDYPTTRVIKSYGAVIFDVEISTDLESLTIVYNPDQYQLQVLDPISFRTSTTMPRLTVDTYLSPGIVYYITEIVDNQFKISTNPTLPPITFYDVGAGLLSVFPENLPYNTFDVEYESASMFSFVISDTFHHSGVFVNNYDIVDVYIGDKKWVLEGDYTSNILPDNKIYVRNNLGLGANDEYTVVSVIYDNILNRTEIEVFEHISIRAEGNGQIGVSFNELSIAPVPTPHPTNSTKYWPTPSWAIGTKVSVSSSASLPFPLESYGTYYYIPLKHLGTFVLSNTRYPLSLDDIIPISSFGSGILSINRAETFFPGATVKIDSSFASRNNGMYYVQQIEEYPTFVRLYVTQHINRITPSTKVYDGNVSIVSDGWDYPYYCPLIQADGLYTETFIHEHLSFQFDDNYSDFVVSTPSEESNTVVVATAPGYTILMTGYDTQPFGLGNVDENVNTLP